MTSNSVEGVGLAICDALNRLPINELSVEGERLGAVNEELDVSSVALQGIAEYLNVARQHLDNVQHALRQTETSLGAYLQDIGFTPAETTAKSIPAPQKISPLAVTGLPVGYHPYDHLFANPTGKRNIAHIPSEPGVLLRWFPYSESETTHIYTPAELLSLWKIAVEQFGLLKKCNVITPEYSHTVATGPQKKKQTVLYTKVEKIEGEVINPENPDHARYLAPTAVALMDYTELTARKSKYFLWDLRPSQCAARVEADGRISIILLDTEPRVAETRDESGQVSYGLLGFARNINVFAAQYLHHTPKVQLDVLRRSARFIADNHPTLLGKV